MFKIVSYSSSKNEKGYLLVKKNHGLLGGGSSPITVHNAHKEFEDSFKDAWKIKEPKERLKKIEETIHVSLTALQPVAPLTLAKFLLENMSHSLKDSVKESIVLLCKQSPQILLDIWTLVNKFSEDIVKKWIACGISEESPFAFNSNGKTLMDDIIVYEIKRSHEKIGSQEVGSSDGRVHSMPIYPSLKLEKTPFTELISFTLNATGTGVLENFCKNKFFQLMASSLKVASEFLEILAFHNQIKAIQAVLANLNNCADHIFTRALLSHSAFKKVPNADIELQKLREHTCFASENFSFFLSKIEAYFLSNQSDKGLENNIRYSCMLPLVPLDIYENLCDVFDKKMPVDSQHDPEGFYTAICTERLNEKKKFVGKLVTDALREFNSKNYVQKTWAGHEHEVQSTYDFLINPEISLEYKKNCLVAQCQSLRVLAHLSDNECNFHVNALLEHLPRFNKEQGLEYIQYLFASIKFFKNNALYELNKQQEYSYPEQEIPDQNQSMKNAKNLVKDINKVMPTTKLAKNKDIVLFLGPTGSGKTTSINWYAGCEMVPSVVEIQRGNKLYKQTVISAKNELSGFKIGHAGSETSVMNIHQREDNILLADSPGFHDTKGNNTDIVNAIALTRSMQNAKSIKFILTIKWSALEEARGEGIRKLLDLIGKLFEDPSANINSCMLLVTGAEGKSADDVLNKLATIEVQDQRINHFLEQILNRGSSGIFVLDPLKNKPHEVDAILQQYIAPLNVGQSTFNYILSNESYHYLLSHCREMESLAQTYIDDGAFQQAKRYVDALKALAENINLPILREIYQNCVVKINGKFSYLTEQALLSYENGLFANTKNILNGLNKILLMEDVLNPKSIDDYGKLKESIMLNIAKMLEQSKDKNLVFSQLRDLSAKLQAMDCFDEDFNGQIRQSHEKLRDFTLQKAALHTKLCCEYIKTNSFGNLKTAWPELVSISNMQDVFPGFLKIFQTVLERLQATFLAQIGKLQKNIDQQNFAGSGSLLASLEATKTFAGIIDPALIVAHDEYIKKIIQATDTMLNNAETELVKSNYSSVEKIFAQFHIMTQEFPLDVFSVIAQRRDQLLSRISTHAAKLRNDMCEKIFKKNYVAARESMDRLKKMSLSVDKAAQGKINDEYEQAVASLNTDIQRYKVDLETSLRDHNFGLAESVIATLNGLALLHEHSNSKELAGYVKQHIDTKIKSLTEEFLVHLKNNSYADMAKVAGHFHDMAEKNLCDASVLVKCIDEAKKQLALHYEKLIKADVSKEDINSLFNHLRAGKAIDSFTDYHADKLYEKAKQHIKNIAEHTMERIISDISQVKVPVNDMKILTELSKLHEHIGQFAAERLQRAQTILDEKTKSISGTALALIMNNNFDGIDQALIDLKNLNDIISYQDTLRSITHYLNQQMTNALTCLDSGDFSTLRNHLLNFKKCTYKDADKASPVDLTKFFTELSQKTTSVLVQSYNEFEIALKENQVVLLKKQYDFLKKSEAIAEFVDQKVYNDMASQLKEKIAGYVQQITKNMPSEKTASPASALQAFNVLKALSEQGFIDEAQGPYIAARDQLLAALKELYTQANTAYDKGDFVHCYALLKQLAAWDSLDQDHLGNYIATSTAGLRTLLQQKEDLMHTQFDGLLAQGDVENLALQLTHNKTAHPDIYARFCNKLQDFVKKLGAEISECLVKENFQGANERLDTLKKISASLDVPMQPKNKEFYASFVKKLDMNNVKQTTDINECIKKKDIVKALAELEKLEQKLVLKEHCDSVVKCNEATELCKKFLNEYVVNIIEAYKKNDVRTATLGFGKLLNMQHDLVHTVCDDLKEKIAALFSEKIKSIPDLLKKREYKQVRDIYACIQHSKTLITEHIPHIRFEQEFQNVVTIMSKDIQTLIDNFMHHCSDWIVQKDGFETIDKEYTNLTQHMLENMKDIFPTLVGNQSNMWQQAVQVIGNAVEELIKRHEEAHPPIEIKNMKADRAKKMVEDKAELLLKLWNFHNRVSSLKSGRFDRFERILAPLKKTTFIDQVADQLKKLDEAKGNEIINFFPQFQRIKYEQLQEATRGVSLPDAIKGFNPSLNESKMTEYYKKYEGRFKETLNAAYQIKQGDVYILQQVNQAIKENDALKLVADICAMWSYKASKNNEVEVGEGQVSVEGMKLHFVQALTIFKLLGLDANGTSIDDVIKSKLSSMTQVSTGEGKSLINGVLAAFYALKGYNVKCVCYSSLLSDRDDVQFDAVFRALNVRNKITYATFGAVANTLINKHGDVRELTEQLVKNELKPSKKSVSDQKEILIFDEADVFLSDNFYGNTYNPCKLISLPEIHAMLQIIWDKRSIFINAQDNTYFDNTACLGQLNLINDFRNACHQANTNYSWPAGFLDFHLNKMISACKVINSGEHSYYPYDGKIGYKEGDIISTNTYYGYNTVFAYIQEAKRGKIVADILKDKTGLYVSCGGYSYAELPNEFLKKMGVTGTLESLNKYEKNILEDKYNITKISMAPSMFQIKDSKSIFNPELNVKCVAQPEWFQKINDAMVAHINAERPIIVYFDSPEDIRAFEQDFRKRYPDRKLNILDEQAAKKDNLIREASYRGQITLVSRSFGRGTDFVCYDSEVDKKGGVVIIQTFFAKDMKEEVQIKGRTGRQGKNGLVEFVLNSQYLVKEYAIDPTELGKVQPTKLYAFLHKKRMQLIGDEQAKIEKNVLQAKQKHQNTQEYVQYLIQGNGVNRSGLLLQTTKF